MSRRQGLVATMVAMPPRERAVDRGTRIASHDLVTTGVEIRTARVAAGLSLRDVGRACGMSYSQAGRIERAVLRSVTAIQLARVGAVVGLDVRIRAYPGPAPIRDAAQVALMSRFRLHLHSSLSLRLEVPIPLAGDQRAWDGVVTGLVDGPHPAIPIECETRLYDLQAQLRRVQLKSRDADMTDVLLVVSGTRTNRRVVRDASPILSDLFPITGRRALAALRVGRHPGGSAIIFV